MPVPCGRTWRTCPAYGIDESCDQEAASICDRIVVPCFATTHLWLDLFASPLRRPGALNCQRGPNVRAGEPKTHIRGGNMRTSKSRLRALAIAVTLAGCTAAPAAHAGDPSETRSQPSKQSNAGALAGLAIGALAAGPVGAVIGAGAGVALGDRYHRQAQASAALSRQLDASEAERARLDHDLAQRDSSLAQSQLRGQHLDEALQRTDQVGLDVSFRTDDDALTAQSISPLLKLGALAASVPHSRVRIAGYADPRGSDAYNQDLSLRRAQSVAAVLESAGVPGERMLIEAHGKSGASPDGDLDGYALERRVTVRLELAGAGEVAQRD
jgi:outer membrane protein OmpA-like peptidoglycan-associated protein